MLGSVAIFVPSVSVKKIEKAIELSADTIYFDLEDSVAPNQKDEARTILSHALDSIDFGGKCLVVRINSIETRHWCDDARMVACNPRVSALLLPQATMTSVAALVNFLHDEKSPCKIIPLIESARGLEEAAAIAATFERVAALQFGAEDYTVSLGVKRTPGGGEILYARARLANAAHAYGLEAIDTPFALIGDPELLIEDAQKAKEVGFTGKAVIHPAHIQAVKDVFLPCDAEVDFARRLVAAYRGQCGDGQGVFSFEGGMIDAPVLKRAWNVLQKAGVASMTASLHDATDF